MVPAVLSGEIVNSRRIRAACVAGLIASAIALAAGGAAHALDVLQVRAMFGVRTVETGAAPLIPDPDAAGFADSEAFLRSVWSFRHDAGPLRFSGQARLVRDGTGDAPNGREAEAGGKAAVNELSIAYSIGSNIVAFAGRRNLSAGQSLGINPADVFLDESRLDRTVPPERRRSEIQGIDLLGAETYFDDGGSLLAYWAPSAGSLNEESPDRAYLSYRATVGGNLADLAIFAFNDDAPGTGLSLASPYDSGLILYGDLAFRKGRRLPEVLTDGTVGAKDTDPWTTESTIGLSYPYPSGLTVNLEYTRLSGGYSAAEWERYLSAVALNTPPLSMAQGDALDALGKIADIEYLSRNYSFFRLYHPDPFLAQVEASMTAIYGIDDGSGSLTLRLRRELSEAVSVSMFYRGVFGDDDDQFLRGAERQSVGVFLETAF